MFDLIFIPNVNERYAIDQLIDGKTAIYTFADVLELCLVGSDQETEKRYEAYEDHELFVHFDIVIHNLTDKYVDFLSIPL